MTAKTGAPPPRRSLVAHPYGRTQEGRSCELGEPAKKIRSCICKSKIGHLESERDFPVRARAPDSTAKAASFEASAEEPGPRWGL